MGKRKIRILFQVHLLKRLANTVNFPDTMAEEVHFIIRQTCEEQYVFKYYMTVIFREACKYIQEHLTINVEELGKECIINAAKTSMSSKIIGSYPFFSTKALTLLGREFRDAEINAKY